MYIMFHTILYQPLDICLCMFAQGCPQNGFCLLNNVAIALAYARIAWGLRKIAIIDFGAAFGNGTDEILMYV